MNSESKRWASHPGRIATLVLMTSFACSMGEAPAGQGRSHYARPFQPPTQPAFLPLPAGAVEPAGWLRDWCVAAKDGFTGHMDDYDQAFKNAWAADYRMTGEQLNNWSKGSWPYEGGGYWFDGLARLGYALHDEGLIEQARRRLGVVAGHVSAEGTLFLWWINRNNPEDSKKLGGWPIWACGLLGRAMSGYYDASREPRILQALETAYAGNDDRIREGWSMSNVWPAYDTYTWTGNKKIAAALSELFADKGPKEGPGANSLGRYRRMPGPGAVQNDHVVHFLETTTPWAVGYLWTGKREYLDVALAWHELLDRVAMQPYGVPVADEWYGPAGAFRGTETCDVAGYIWSQCALLSVTGDGRRGDRLERAFFNAGPATVARDFKTHVYFQSPNRFANRSPDFPHGPKASGGSYAPKHSPLCCTAALNRIVPYYVTHMWMATPDNGLVAACYGPCKVKALAADRVPVEIACDTEYPFGEAIEMTVRPARDAEFPLLLRIPDWCSNPRLELNGAAIPVDKNGDGFARIDRKWKSGDAIRLHLPMTVMIEKGRDAAQGAPYDGRHRAMDVSIPEKPPKKGAPYASVAYGPLLFSLPIPDKGDANTPDPSARWAYALNSKEADITVMRSAMPARWDWPLESPLRLKAKGVAIDWKPAPEAPRLPADFVTGIGAPEDVTLVPYGCTKFRISMFPVTAESWGQ